MWVATLANWFAADHFVGRKYRSIAVGAMQQALALSSKCG